MSIKSRTYLALAAAFATVMGLIFVAPPTSANTVYLTTRTITVGIGTCSLTVRLNTDGSYAYDATGGSHETYSQVTVSRAAERVYMEMDMGSLQRINPNFSVFVPGDGALLAQDTDFAPYTKLYLKNNVSESYVTCIETTGGHQYQGFLEYHLDTHTWTKVISDPA
jgi:hypothetical protein